MLWVPYLKQIIGAPFLGAGFWNDQRMVFQPPTLLGRSELGHLWAGKPHGGSMLWRWEIVS